MQSIEELTGQQATLALDSWNPSQKSERSQKTNVQVHSQEIVSEMADTDDAVNIEAVCEEQAMKIMNGF